MKPIHTLKDIDLANKRVLIRVDFNVPMKKDGTVADITRIQAALPTIEYCINKNAKVILLSHLGRPTNGPAKEFTLKPCADELAKLLKRPVQFASDCIGDVAEQAVSGMKPQDVLLLENVRFYPAEEKPKLDPTFVEKLAALGDCYINDAFGTAHRAHSSTTLLATYFPDQSAIGFLMQKEVEALSKALLSPARPFVAIIGGAKISSKLGVLQSLLKACDTLLIGGAMVYTFMKAQNIPVGDSLVEDDMIPQAKELITFAKEKKKKLLFSSDIVVTDSLEHPTVVKMVDFAEGIPDKMQGVDIGEQTVFAWKPYIQAAKTIFWNGPLGVFEQDRFAKGTKEIAMLIAEEAYHLFSVVGGGDSIAAIHQLGLESAFSHISTGGGASMEFIEFGTLPGIEALRI